MVPVESLRDSILRIEEHVTGIEAFVGFRTVEHPDGANVIKTISVFLGRDEARASDLPMTSHTTNSPLGRK